MKPKKLIFATILMFFAILQSAWALEPLSDWDLKQIIGQAQVDIDIMELTVSYEIGEVSYTDDDGTDGTPATVFIKDITVSRTFHSIYDITDQDGTLQMAYGDEDVLGSYALKPGQFSPISITTADTVPMLSAMNMFNQTGKNPITNPATPLTNDYAISGIMVTLPTIEIVTHYETFTIGMRRDGAVNNEKEFLRVERGQSVMAVLGGKVEIAAR